MKQVYYKGLIGMDAKRFIACIFFNDDYTDPDPVTHVELTLLIDGSIMHFNHPDEYENIVTHQKQITEVEYRLLGLMAKFMNELFLSKYFKPYPHKPVCDILINSISADMEEYRKKILNKKEY